MKRIIIYNILILLAVFCSIFPSLALTAEYAITWNAGSCNVEIPADEGETPSAIESTISYYITSNSISWLSLNSVESGSTTELWELCFFVTDNTGGSSRSADFTPWGFRIVQAAQGSAGPIVTSPSGGVATLYPGAAVSVTVDNLTASARVALRGRPLSGGAWTVVDSLSLTAPSCSFSLVLEDGEYEFAPLGIGFSVTYPDILYYRYSVSGLYSNTIIDCNGERKTGYITGYTDAGGISHSVDSALAGQLQQLFSWYNSGNADGWDPKLKLNASLSSGRILVTATAPPNYGQTRTWDTGLRLSSSARIVFSQPDGGDLVQKNCIVNDVMAQVPSSQFGVTYTVTDGEHNINATGTGSSLNIYLSGSCISGAYSVYASYRGRTRLLKKYNPDNDIPPSDGTLEGTGPNSIIKITMNGSAGNATDIVYYDGLGFEKQEVAVRASGDGLKDIVRPVRLDHLGREWRSYLPYAVSSTSGTYRRYAFNEQASWWYDWGGSDEGSEYAYSTNVMEDATVGRTLTEKLPGEDYHDASHDTDYSYSTGSLQKLSVDDSGTLSQSGYYSSWAVSCTSVTDGDGHIKLSYTDREGRLLADGPDGSLAYYVYDPCGRLAWMISPEGAALLTGNGSWTATSDFATKYCYVYVYDNHGRMVEKRLPGAAVQYFVYDSGDRLAFFQDGIMRENGQWKALFYDTCGRLVREDLRSAASSVTRETLQAGFDASSVPTLYTTVFGVTLLRTYVYDAYPTGMDSRLSFQPDAAATLSTLRPSPKGLQTYENLAVLGSSLTAARARYYDSEDRIIQEVTLFPDGTILRTSKSYDLQGRELESISKYQDTGAETGKSALLIDTYQYDAQGRMSEAYSQLSVDNLTAESSVSYSFDDLGRPERTIYGPGLSPIATQLHTYTKQGWEASRTVTGASNNTLFSSALHYESPLSNYGYTGANNSVSWAGRISSWEWQQLNRPASAFAFTYNSTGCLTNSEYYFSGLPCDKYSEAFSYDLNCNIISQTIYSDEEEAPVTLYRNMSGNQRRSYDYDANGNIACTHDWIEEESGYDYSPMIVYNMLNLPLHVSTDGDEYLDLNILADGTKVSVIGYEDNGYRYVGPFKYKIEFGEAFIESCSSAGGRFWCLDSESDPDTYCFIAEPTYFLTDHLESTRVVVKSDGSLSMQADYLPYGRILYKTSGYNEIIDYLWTGKESLPWLFGNWYDSGARFLTTDGFFPSIDPLAEKYPGVSPYAYCAGDPVNKIDPDGNIWETAIDVASLATGIKSFVSNVKEGNVGGAVIDGLGIVIDAVAVITPFAPGVAGASIKALRAVDKGADAIKAADKVTDTAKAVDKVGEASKANRLQKLNESAKTGQEAHRQIEKELVDNYGARKEVSITLNDGTKVRKDAQMPDGTFVIIKPDTPSGHIAAAKREKMVQDSGYKTKKIFYDPSNPAYRPGSSLYIGPQKR